MRVPARRIWRCKFNGWGNHNCEHKSDVGVPGFAQIGILWLLDLFAFLNFANVSDVQALGQFDIIIIGGPHPELMSLYLGAITLLCAKGCVILMSLIGYYIRDGGANNWGVSPWIMTFISMFEELSCTPHMFGCFERGYAVPLSVWVCLEIVCSAPVMSPSKTIAQ